LDTGDYRAGPPVVEWDAAGTALPPGVKPGSFDGVCAVEMLEHVENPRQALRNFFALLRPGGILIVSTPNVSHPRSRLKFLLRGAPSYFGRTEYYGSGHTTMLPDWMLELHLKETGFEHVAVEYAGLMGLTGKQQMAYRAIEPALSMLRLLPSPRVDDGCVTFAIGRKPGQQRAKSQEPGAVPGERKGSDLSRHR
jgi:SAM-dependent methyltransferase